MFIDLSGFTPLTETLMKKGKEGAEQLSISLNNIFEPMVHLVYNRGGFIPYFAGDAFTAIFLNDQQSSTPEAILSLASEIRDTFSKSGIEKTRFGDFAIAVKVGLSYGDVEWGITGKEHQSFYFRGQAIDNCAECEHHAQQQEIILDDAFLQQLNLPNLPLTPLDGDQFFKLLQSFKTKETPKFIPWKPFTVPSSVLDRFLPKAVSSFMGVGEFRNVISIFISFSGVKEHNYFNQFSSVIQDQMDSFSGYLKEIDFGDKGGVIVGFFGAPVTFENNVERALEFVTAIKEELRPIQERGNLKYRIGMTYGLAYTGLVGGHERCQYAVVGNRVNLAARLMTKAEWGEVLVDHDIHKSRYFTFSHTGDIQYKGISENIPTYRLEGRNLANQVLYSGAMIGRDAEIRRLKEMAEPILDDQSAGVAYVFGEAGIGKSRLAFELKRLLSEKAEIYWLSFPADQILRKPFNPFITFLSSFFNQSTDLSPAENQRKFDHRFDWLLKDLEQVEKRDTTPIINELLRTKSILAAAVGIITSDSLYEQLDARGRYQNFLSAIFSFLKAAASIRPLVIELEDGHWYDQDSINLLRQFTRQMRNLPIFCLITSRYADDGSRQLLLSEEFLEARGIPSIIVDLNVLQKDALRQFAETQLGGKIAEPFYDVLLRTSNGNPFYLEQILEFFSESDLLEKQDSLWNIKDENIKLSSSVSSILMARIDRLSTLVKETVKTAAVIGREFEIPVLNEVLKNNNDFQSFNGNLPTVLKEQVRHAEQGQIWRAINELRYIFKHSLLREAVYDMQLHTKIRSLHLLIAEAMEKLYAKNLSVRYADLAFHYEQAEQTEKTLHYLRLAGDHARNNFQNQKALEYYHQLLNYEAYDGEDRVTTLLKISKVLTLVGEWDKCEQRLQEALSLARQISNPFLTAKANNSLGYLLMLKGAYTSADEYINASIKTFEKLKDTQGMARSFGDLGNLYFRQGDYNEAKEFFVKSIELNRKEDLRTNSQIFANLGLTYMNQGDYEEGIQCQLQALAEAKAVNDKSGMATLHTNLGIVYFESGQYDKALDHYQKGLKLSEELGNKQLTAIAIGCIGSVYQKKGDYDKALDNFIRDLAICEELGDKQGTAIALGLIGELRSLEGEFEVAIEYLKQNLILCEELGYQKGIAKAVNTLGDVYTLKGNFPEAEKHYLRAIEVSRNINNRLVLGYSLVELANVYIMEGSYKAAHDLHLEGMAIAEELGNPDLIFEAAILESQVNYFTGNPDGAYQILLDLSSRTRNTAEAAAVQYELHQLKPNAGHDAKALELYLQLYVLEPKYIFKQRVEELKASVTK